MPHLTQPVRDAVAGGECDSADASDSSSECESDDSAGVPYIVDVAAVSASLAHSMSDKGVQLTDSAKRAMLAAQRHAPTEDAASDSESAGDADEEATSEADETSSATLFDIDRPTISPLRSHATPMTELTRAAGSAPGALSPRVVAPHSAASAWPAPSAWPALPPLPLPLSRPATPSSAAAAASGGLTCRPAVLRPSTATNRTPRPASASAVSPPLWSSPSYLAPHSVTDPPSPPSLDSLQLPVDCFGASGLTSSRHAVLRGNFLSAARERRKQSNGERSLAGQSDEWQPGMAGARQRVAGRASVESGVLVASSAAVDVSRASTAPSSASASLSFLDASSSPSSPSSFRVSPRSPASPVSPSLRSRAASEQCSAQPTSRAPNACVFPIQPTSSRQRARQRSVRVIH